MSTSIYEIPTQGGVPERFLVDLSGATYEMVLRWNEALQGWSLDIATQAGVPLVQGLTLVPGVDLLQQHRHLGIPGALEVKTLPKDETNPTFDGLGTSSRLYYVVTS